MTRPSTRLSTVVVSGLAAVAMAFASGPAWAAPTVTLTVLNPPNGSGEVVLAQGDGVQVDFDVVDPLSETSKNDLIQLVDIGSGIVVNSIKRGTALTGSLGVSAKDPGMLEVQYIAASDGSLWGSATTTVTVVVDPATILLIDRISALEALLAATGVDLASLGTTVATNTSNIATNASDIGTNASGIASNASGIATTGSAIATNASAIGTNASGLSTLAADIATNSSGIATNASGIATNASGLTSLAGLISTNTSDIGTNASGIASNASGLASLATTVAANTTAIGTNVSDIGTNASGIASNASAIAALSGTDLPALQTQVSTNTADISGLKTGLSSLGSVVNINRGNIAVHDGAIFTNTQRIAGLNTDVIINRGNIQNNADGVAQNDRVIGDLYTDITDNATGIANNAFAILGLSSVDVTALQRQVNNIAANTVLDLDGMLTYDSTSMTARFDGVNVQITDGSGSTYRGPGQGALPSFLGNLIIGYNNPTVGRCTPTALLGVLDGSTCTEQGGTWDPNHFVRSGPAPAAAHCLIVGDGHRTVGTYGSVLFGARNGVAATSGASMLGGANNRTGAYADGATILGGNNNRVGDYAFYATVAGGRDNRSAGLWTSIAGGFENQAFGDTNSITGGRGNEIASGQFNTITGGFDNLVRNSVNSVVVGGDTNVLGRLDAIILDSQVLAGGDDVVLNFTNPGIYGEFVQNSSGELRNRD